MEVIRLYQPVNPGNNKVWSRSLKRQSVTVVFFLFCMVETINVPLMVAAFFCDYFIEQDCCRPFPAKHESVVCFSSFASLPLCYRSKLAKLSPLFPPGMLTFPSLRGSHAGKAGCHGDKSPNISPWIEGGGRLQVAGDSGGNANGLPVFVILVHQHLDAVGVSRRDPGTACDGEIVAGIEWQRLLPAVDQRPQHIRRHAPEALADETVEKEVDAGVEQC